MARVLGYPTLDSPEAVKGTCDPRRLRSDCADAQADLNLRWSHSTYCRFVVRWLIDIAYCTAMLNRESYDQTVQAQIIALTNGKGLCKTDWKHGQIWAFISLNGMTVCSYYNPFHSV